MYEAAALEYRGLKNSASVMGRFKTGHSGATLCSHHEGHEVGSQGIHV